MKQCIDRDIKIIKNMKNKKRRKMGPKNLISYPIFCITS